MVMSTMREKTKIILFVALIAFVGLIFFDWGMQKSGRGGGGRGGVIARVNDREIPWDTYQRIRQQAIADFESRTGRSAEYSDYDAIDEDAWIQLVRDAVVQEQIEKYDIAISDAEILTTLRTNPPAAVRAGFINDDGEFDVAAYGQALADPAMATQWAAVEDFLRETLPPQKLQNYVGLAARVTSAEVRQRFVDRNEKVTVRYVAASPARMEVEDDAVTDQDVEEYFREHSAEYATAERAVLQYVRASKTPSTADSLDAREFLGELRRDALSGQDFAELARTWSEDASADRGGDLGWVGRGDMVPEFDGVAWSTPTGEISEVFATPFGYHILKVEERREEESQEQLHVRHILLRVEASTETLHAAEDVMDGFYEALAGKTPFEAAAETAGLTVETTEPFEAGRPIPGVGVLGRVERFAFSSPVGAVTPDPIENRTAIFAFRLQEKLPAGVPALETVREQVRADAIAERQRELARAAMEEALAAGDGSLESIASALPATLDAGVQESKAFARESFVPQIGRRNEFVATAFALAPGERSGLVETDRGFYVMEVVSREEADEAAFAEQRDQIRSELLQQKRQYLITSWLESLIHSAEVIDYRGGGDGVPWTLESGGLYYSGA